MNSWQPKYYLIAGGFMVVAAFVLSMLMVMAIIPSTLFINFVTYGLSVTGFILGIVGTAMIMRMNRNDKP